MSVHETQPTSRAALDRDSDSELELDADKPSLHAFLSRLNPANVFPILNWGVADYRHGWRDKLKGDVVAGLTVGFMLIPQGMAYALLAGLPPIYAMDSLLTFSTIGSILTTEELENEAVVVSLALVLTFMAGIIQLGMGIANLGVLANFLSFSVMSGFTTAASIIIAISQLKYIFGIPNVERFTGIGSNFRTLYEVLSRLDESNPYTIGISVLSIATIVYLRWWKKNRFNAETATGSQRTFRMICELNALFVTVLGSLWVLAYDQTGVVNVRSGRESSADKRWFVDVVGDVPPGLKSPSFPELSSFNDRIDAVIFGAGIIALVGFMELYAIANVYAEKNGYKLNANNELMALGSANTLGSVFQAMVVSGSFSRTAVNSDAGARTLLANAITGLICLCALLLLAPLVYYIPMAVLASIIEVAIINLIKISDFRQAWELKRRADLLVMVITFVFTIGLGIQQGIAIGVVISIIVTVRHSAFPRFSELGRVANSVVFRDINYDKSVTTYPNVVVLRHNAELYFANTDLFQREIISRSAGMACVVLDCSIMMTVDLQGVIVMKKLVGELKTRKITLRLAAMRGPVRKVFSRSGIAEMVGEENMFADVSDAVAAALKEANPTAPATLVSSSALIAHYEEKEPVLPHLEEHVELVEVKTSSDHPSSNEEDSVLSQTDIA